MTIIDAHHHVWDLSVRGQGWITGERMAPIRRSFSLDDLRPDARAAGVTATVLVQTVTVAAETPEMLALADADPLVAGVVGWTDLTSPAVADGAPLTAFVPAADVILSAFGAERTMFGSDWPVCLLAVGYAGVIELAWSLAAGLTDAERQRFSGQPRHGPTGSADPRGALAEREARRGSYRRGDREDQADDHLRPGAAGGEATQGG